MIFVIDDDRIMAECIARACNRSAVKIFDNAIEAMQAIGDGEMPEIIFLDVLLVGPDGFTFLNELASYGDTAKIPIVLVTSLDIDERGLSNYGVVGVLEKDTMKPEDIGRYVDEFAK